MIFGSAYPMMPVERCLDEIAALPLKDGVRRKWMHDNAARFLGIER
jgi:predicted TIM-barrel fold metal-dependent hydrolase